MSILTVDLSKKTVAVDGELVVLTGTEYRIVKLLAINSKSSISNDQLARIVFGATVEERESALPKWHIGHIRKKGINIVTRRSFGYHLEYDQIIVLGDDTLKLMINEFGGSLSPSIERIRAALVNTLREVDEVLSLVRAHERTYRQNNTGERSRRKNK